VQVVLAYIGYCSFQSYSSAAAYWGILTNSWMTVASMTLTAASLSWLAVAVVVWRRLSRRWLLAFMVGLHLLEACGVCLAAAAGLGSPVQVSQEVSIRHHIPGSIHSV
jgi:hypothetical protein